MPRDVTVFAEFELTATLLREVSNEYEGGWGRIEFNYDA